MQVTVNGRAHVATVEPRKTLADFLREECQLTGTHLGCEHGVCGACTVLLDGAAVRSCLVFAVQADGADVTTIEGIGGARRRALRGAVGVPRLPRLAVRFLHARLRRVGDRVPPRPPRPRPTTRSASRCRAPSAAAPATRASSPRCARRPTPLTTRNGNDGHDRRQRAVRRGARPPRRGRAAAHRPRHLRRRRRCPGMLHAYFVRSPFARPRSAGSTRRRRSPRRACGSCSPPPT